MPSTTPAAPTPPRPKFVPETTLSASPDLEEHDAPGWVNVISAPAYFPLDIFMQIMDQLCRNPERNSALILRADILHESSSPSPAPQITPPPHLKLRKRIRRRLMPRRPTRDLHLEQECYFLSSDAEGPKTPDGMVVLVPDVEKEEDVPFYHPPIRKLAFRYTSSPTAGAPDPVAEEPRVFGRISIAVLPFPPPNGRAAETGEEGLPLRTQRICLHLLETVHKHSWGIMTGYEKRVNHDIVVEKTQFQDLYLTLKERHKHLDSQKPKMSNKLLDVKRHVWKDVAIAAFLMLLWKDMYPSREVEVGEEGVTGEVWDAWGRPSEGFLDLGCGNGLLVHILSSEGYKGLGIELRARRTWPTYPESTQAVLRENGVSPPDWFPPTMEAWRAGEWEEGVVREGMFLIGNHSDELTPWLPLFSLLPATPIPFLSLPCCLHTLTGMFTSNTWKPPTPHPHIPEKGFEDGLEAGESRYNSYLKWLGWQGLLAGWRWETESLRVPSTRGKAIVGRGRWTTSLEEDVACREWAFEQVQRVREVGFQVRQKEGGVDH